MSEEGTGDVIFTPLQFRNRILRPIARYLWNRTKKGTVIEQDAGETRATE